MKTLRSQTRLAGPDLDFSQVSRVRPNRFLSTIATVMGGQEDTPSDPPFPKPVSWELLVRVDPTARSRTEHFPLSENKRLVILQSVHSGDRISWLYLWSSVKTLSTANETTGALREPSLRTERTHRNHLSSSTMSYLRPRFGYLRPNRTQATWRTTNHHYCLISWRSSRLFRTLGCSDVS